MEFVRLTRESSTIPVLERINEEPISMKDKSLILNLVDTGATVMAIYEYSEAIGFAVVREYKDIIYLAYLAIARDSRSRGFGTAAVEELADQYYEKQVIVEYEAPESPNVDPAVCIKRRNFYRRNGFKKTGWYALYGEVEFEIACAGAEFDVDMFIEFKEDLSKTLRTPIPHPYRKDF